MHIHILTHCKFFNRKWKVGSIRRFSLSRTMFLKLYIFLWFFFCCCGWIECCLVPRQWYWELPKSTPTNINIYSFEYLLKVIQGKNKFRIEPLQFFAAIILTGNKDNKNICQQLLCLTIYSNTNLFKKKTHWKFKLVFGFVWFTVWNSKQNTKLWTKTH